MTIALQTEYISGYRHHNCIHLGASGTHSITAYVDPDSEAAPSVSPVFSALAVSPFSSGFVADFAKDCSKSFMISSMCSVPTLMRIRSSDTPEFCFSSSLSCSWVVLQGWIARVLESPTLSRTVSKGRRESVVWGNLLCQVGDELEVIHNLASCGTSTLDAKRQNTSKAPREVLLRQLMRGVTLKTRV